MSATRHATANVTLNSNFVVFVDGERAVACLSLGTQLQESASGATACFQCDCNFVVFCRGEDNCMSASRHATANFAPGCNFLVFIDMGMAIACLSLGTQL